MIEPGSPDSVAYALGRALRVLVRLRRPDLDWSALADTFKSLLVQCKPEITLYSTALMMNDADLLRAMMLGSSGPRWNRLVATKNYSILRGTPVGIAVLKLHLEAGHDIAPFRLAFLDSAFRQDDDGQVGFLVDTFGISPADLVATPSRISGCGPDLAHRVAHSLREVQSAKPDHLSNLLLAAVREADIRTLTVLCWMGCDLEPGRAMPQGPQPGELVRFLDEAGSGHFHLGLRLAYPTLEDLLSLPAGSEGPGMLRSSASPRARKEDAGRGTATVLNRLSVASYLVVTGRERGLLGDGHAEDISLALRDIFLAATRNTSPTPADLRLAINSLDLRIITAILVRLGPGGLLSADVRDSVSVLKVIKAGRTDILRLLSEHGAPLARSRDQMVKVALQAGNKDLLDFASSLVGAQSGLLQLTPNDL